MADITVSGSGTGCVPVIVNGDNKFNVEINCSAYDEFNPSDKFIVITFDADINVLSDAEKTDIIDTVTTNVLARAQNFLGITLFKGDIQVVIKEGSVNVEVEFSADTASNVTDLAANITAVPISVTINGAAVASSSAAVQTASSSNGSSGLSSGEIAGVVIGSIFLVGIVIVVSIMVIGKAGGQSNKVAQSPAP